MRLAATLICLSLAATASRAQSATADALAAVLGDPDAGFKARATAAIQLGRVRDPRAAIALASALRNDPHYAVRAAAASGLGRAQAVETMPALVDALSDPEELVVAEAKMALDQFHSTHAVEGFRLAMRSDVVDARLASVRAFGQMARRDPSLGTHLVAATADGTPEVAFAAERALEGLSHDVAVPLLLAGLQSTESDTRMAAARLFRRRPDPRAVFALTALATSADEGEAVRAPARSALKAQREYLDLQVLRADAQGNAAPQHHLAVRTLAILGEPDALGFITRDLASGDAGTRINAARAAIDTRTPEARAALSRALASEADPRVHRQLELLLQSAR